MKDYIEERAVEIAEYIIETKATVRQSAKKFGVSKSTVHKDMTQKLPLYNAAMSAVVRAVMEENKAERHLRGGEATKMKYLMIRKQSEDEAKDDEFHKR